MLSPIVHALITSLPTLLVAASGFAVAVVMLQRNGPAALLACGGCLLVLAYEGVGIAFPFLLQRLEEMQVAPDQIEIIDLVYFLVDDFVLAVGVALLLGAAFAGRPRATRDGSRPGGQPQAYEGQPPTP